MKLASFAAEGMDRIGFALENGNLVDLADAFQIAADQSGQMIPECPADMMVLLRHSDELLPVLKTVEQLLQGDQAQVKQFTPEQIVWYAPVRHPSKICCIALNNAALNNIKISAPNHPAFFLKPQTALVGHQQPIVLKKEYGVTHPEPELAVIIGRRVKDADPEEALDAVFGYSVHNDVTSVTMRNEDSFHFRFGQPKEDGSYEMVDGHTSYAGRYKGSDTFAALGPWIVTKDEVPDPHQLDVQCEIVGEMFMDDNTRNLTHKVPDVVAFVSRFQTLLPGDVISMGTALNPEGETGKPLTMGDLNRLGGPVTITISSVGTLSNTVRHA